MPRRTREDLDVLKAQWAEDPCWDIENTEGFESHCDELLAFRTVTEAEWARERRRTIEERAAELGCSVAMAGHVISLEARIADLTRRFQALEDQA